MGICFGSEVPETIIDDPKEGDSCHVLFKKTGLLSRDQFIYQDCDLEKKWLKMDKQGGLFSNPTYIIENFVRKEGEDFGEVLCAAKLDVKECFTYGHETHDDSDSSGSDSGSDDGIEEHVEKTKMKWAQKIKVKFYSDREMTNQIGEVKVKAKGKAKKTVTTTITTEEDGTEKHESSTEIKKKCKKLKYTIEELHGHEDDMPKIKIDGKPNHSAHKLAWDSDCFSAECNPGSWGSDQIEVKTSWKHPALGMLMGYIIAKEISPDDVKDNVHVF